MASPNIVNVTSIIGKTYYNFMASPSTYTSIITNPASSNSVYKINVISISNGTGSARNISVAVYRDPDGAGAAPARYYDIANTVTVPGNSTLVVTSKDTAFYLEEGDILTSFSTSSDTEIMVSYEIIS
jgi:hypothetical protein